MPAKPGDRTKHAKAAAKSPWTQVRLLPPAWEQQKICEL
jgi:hypothetical protein